MLESLVSSRIRRTLLEFLVKSPTERFYLRGLAKTLNLPVTPLRRELKRLEEAGMLQPFEEGNIRFYTVNTASAAFRELQQAASGQPAVAVPPVGAVAVAAAVPAPPPARPALRPRWRAPVLAGVTMVGLAVMVGVVRTSYREMTEEAVRPQPVLADQAEGPSASGTMRSQRLQLVPGGFGGFSQ